MTTLTTEWLRIGRSGATVDGRTIPPLALKQAAETYNPELYTALIWLEHMRMGGHLGKVLALKAEDNEEGGVDLYAQLSPNRNYLAENSIYQEGWFSSMELTADFRKTGKWYLSGLGATNEPASVATTEIRFAKQAEAAGEILGAYVKTELKQFPNDRKDSFFKLFERFFSAETTETDEMSNKQAEQLRAEFKTQLDEVKSELAKFVKNSDTPSHANASTDDIAALQQKNAELTAQNEQFKTQLSEQAEKFTALAETVTKLDSALTEALSEQPSTPPARNNGTADGKDNTVFA